LSDAEAGRQGVSTRRLYDVLAEDFRKDLAEIGDPSARLLFILARASQVIHLRIAEYKARSSRLLTWRDISPLGYCWKAASPIIWLSWNGQSASSGRLLKRR